jgi:hypothetical protein
MEKMVADPEIIFCATGKIVEELQNVFSFKKKMFSLIEIIFWAIQIIFSTIWKTFRAAQKVVFVTQTTLSVNQRLARLNRRPVSLEDSSMETSNPKLATEGKTSEGRSGTPAFRSRLSPQKVDSQYFPINIKQWVSKIFIPWLRQRE